MTVEEDVPLAHPEHDISRVAMLLRRVADQADTPEQIHLPSINRSMHLKRTSSRKEARIVPDWRQFCRGEDRVSVEGGGADVMASNERRHRISVRESAETFELMGIVARPAAIDSVPDVRLRAWRRNRSTQLVGFRIDRKGSLVGEAWVPKAGLDREEFLLYLRRVAAACDLFEYHLTGADRE